jgi:hypothetical protein
VRSKPAAAAVQRFSQHAHLQQQQHHKDA